MKKNLHALKSMPHLDRYLLTIFIIISFVFACKKEIKQEPKDEPVTLQSQSLSANSTVALDYCWDDAEDGSLADSFQKPTILGARLTGFPYSVANMQQASINLTGVSTSIIENKWYVRFKPSNTNQLAILEDLDIDLFDYPLDYELIQEGDYYDDGVTPAEEIPWLYAVVDANFTPPAGITYELLQRMHVPADYRFENEAFRITGNNVDTAGCTSGVAAGSGPEVVALDEECDCRSKPSALSCDCRVQCGFNPCRTPLPPVPPVTIPAGSITVTDNTINQNVGVRNARIIARRFLKVERTYTDAIGNYRFTKSFRNKASLILKSKNNDAVVRAQRGIRLWQAVLPVKIIIGRFRGNLSNIPYNIDPNSNVSTRGVKRWAAFTVHNNIQEFRTYAAAEGLSIPPDKLKILYFPRWFRGSGATPMFQKRGGVLPYVFAAFYLVPVANGTIVPYLEQVAQITDMFLGYGVEGLTQESDEISELSFHELAHASHYSKVGNGWWNNFVNAEVNEIAAQLGANDEFAPYGNGQTGNSPIIALGESWAYHIGHFFTNTKYGTSNIFAFEQGLAYDNGNIYNIANGAVQLPPVATTGLNAHLNLLEDFSPNRTVEDPFSWIPQGLYYDLLDNRNDNIQNPQRVPLNDEVFSYTNQELFNALDADITTVPAYRVRLLQENSNRDAAGVIAIFTGYNY